MGPCARPTAFRDREMVQQHRHVDRWNHPAGLVERAAHPFSHASDLRHRMRHTAIGRHRLRGGKQSGGHVLVAGTDDGRAHHPLDVAHAHMPRGRGSPRHDPRQPDAMAHLVDPARRYHASGLPAGNRTQNQPIHQR